tara:strand:+ start:1101 stop:1439 length:339 start_codon:yes stop_codon:yes gene_type:complete
MKLLKINQETLNQVNQSLDNKFSLRLIESEKQIKRRAYHKKSEKMPPHSVRELLEAFYVKGDKVYSKHSSRYRTADTEAATISTSGIRIIRYRGSVYSESKLVNYLENGVYK